VRSESRVRDRPSGICREAIELHDKIELATAARDDTAASSAARALEDLLFLIDGQR
jgi:hypothetical protein